MNKTTNTFTDLENDTLKHNSHAAEKQLMSKQKYELYLPMELAFKAFYSVDNTNT